MHKERLVYQLGAGILPDRVTIPRAFVHSSMQTLMAFSLNCAAVHIIPEGLGILVEVISPSRLRIQSLQTSHQKQRQFKELLFLYFCSVFLSITLNDLIVLRSTYGQSPLYA